MQAVPSKGIEETDARPVSNSSAVASSAPMRESSRVTRVVGQSGKGYIIPYVPSCRNRPTLSKDCLLVREGFYEDMPGVVSNGIMGCFFFFAYVDIHPALQDDVMPMS